MNSKREKSFWKAIKIILWCCIGIAIYLRTRPLLSLDYDEVFTAITADPTLPLSWIYSHWLLVDVHPPLYNILLWVWNHFVPYGPEGWLRLPSLIFGLGALCFGWFLFPKRYGKTARFLFLVFLSCNVAVMDYCQHARSYMLMLLWSVPLTFSFLQISFKMRKHIVIGWKEWLWFGTCSLLLCWSHYFGALLFGSMSVVLWGQAFYYKYKSKGVFLTPCIVFILFLPWLIPNFISQIEYQRFGGNWWGNVFEINAVFEVLIHFAVGNDFSILMMASILLYVFCSQCMQGNHRGSLYSRLNEQYSLIFVSLIVLLGAAIVSMKSYMFFGRHLMCLLPSIYILFSFWLAPLFRKGIVVGLLLVALCVSNIFYWCDGYMDRMAHYREWSSSDLAALLYRDFFPGEDMLVVPIEGYPPVAMPAMYGHYANKKYHLNIKVFDLVNSTPEEREAIWAAHPNTMMYMPDCDLDKLVRASYHMSRRLVVKARVGTICFLTLGDKIEVPSNTTVDPKIGRINYSRFPLN